MQIFIVIANITALQDACAWVLPGKQVLSFMSWIFTAGLLSMQILQALILLPLNDLRFYKGACKVGIDLPSKVYVIVFLCCWLPLFLLHFLRFAVELNWFDPEAFCYKYYQQSCSTLMNSQECLAKNFHCVYTSKERAITITFVVLSSLIMVVYFAMIIYSRRVLQKASYKEHRISYMELGFQVSFIKFDFFF